MNKLSKQINESIDNLRISRNDLKSQVNNKKAVESIVNNVQNIEQMMKTQKTELKKLKFKDNEISLDKQIQEKDFFQVLYDKSKSDIIGYLELLEKLCYYPKIDKIKSTWIPIEQYTANFKRNLKDIIDNCLKDQKFQEGYIHLGNIKEHLLCQIFAALLYKRHIIWEDCQITQKEYIHAEIYKTIQLACKKQEQIGFRTLKYPLEDISLEEIQQKISGNHDQETYNHNQFDKKNTPQQEHKSHTYIEGLIYCFKDFEEAIRNILSNNNLKQVNEQEKQSDLIIKLRKELEEANFQLKALQIKYSGQLVRNDRLKTDQFEELQDKLIEQANKIYNYEIQIQTLIQQNKRLDFENKEMDHKIKKQTEQFEQLKNVYFEKLNSAERNQDTVLQELRKLKQDFQVFPGILRNEDRVRSQLREEKQQLDTLVQNLSEALGKIKNDLKSEKKELCKKEALITELGQIIIEYQDKQFIAQTKIDKLSMQNEQFNQEINQLKLINQQNQSQLLSMTELNLRLDKELRLKDSQKQSLILRLEKAGLPIETHLKFQNINLQ